MKRRFQREPPSLHTHAILSVGIEVLWKIGLAEVCVSKIGILKIGFREVGFRKVGFAEVCVLKIGILKIGSPEISFAEVSVGEVGAAKRGTRERGISEIGYGEVGIWYNIGRGDCLIMRNGIAKPSFFKLSACYIGTSEDYSQEEYIVAPAGLLNLI